MRHLCRGKLHTSVFFQRESETFIWTTVDSGQQLDVGWGLGAVAGRTSDRKGLGLEGWGNRDDRTRVTSALARHTSGPTPSLYVGALSKFLS